MSKNNTPTAAVPSLAGVGIMRVPTFEVTLTLPQSIFVGTYEGKAIRCELNGLSAALLSEVIPTALVTVLKNAANGGGKADNEADKSAKVLKKMDAWAKGDANVRDRGESQYAAMRDVYLSDCIAVGMTAKAAESAVKAKVAEYMGEADKRAKAAIAAQSKIVPPTIDLSAFLKPTK